MPGPDARIPVADDTYRMVDPEAGTEFSALVDVGAGQKDVEKADDRREWSEASPVQSRGDSVQNDSVNSRV